ncbi:CpsD/CapB family tyrosine-protein kinase [Microvirga rosea]|uniref:CpsD/CapB family tyrosine-protein kinase n=1 Tax=Microvirga rosea TaxID=2715425 RepID=UPI001D0BB62D|nr:CpsD/CapB family tyrosine-protein kinase [Microvirga rosea]MCB8818931.1 CpsD/CapB family tyrosine-protein kinase [Microvirga rosea]
MESIQSTIEKMEREIALVAFREDRVSNLPGAQPSELVWRRLASASLDKKRAAQRRIVTLDRLEGATFRFDILRTKILRTLRQKNWTSIAITSPTPGCGKTLLALNLAFSFANLKECRTALVDLDLRRPQVGNVLGIEKPSSMEGFLKGDNSIEEVFLRYGENLAVGANACVVPYAAELLQSSEAATAIKNLKDKLRPNVLIFDLPPMLVNDDVLAFLPNVDCVILVAAAESSTFNEVDICERSLSQQTDVLGVVLNKCHFSPEEFGY